MHIIWFRLDRALSVDENPSYIIRITTNERKETTMKQLLLAALLGGIVLFLWGWLSWSIIPIHNASLLSIENEDAVIAALHVNMDRKGVYAFPAMPTIQDPTIMDEWEQKYKDGPVGMIIYDPEGTEPMKPDQMIIGFILGCISAFIVAWFLSRSTAAMASYFARVAYCGMFGIFIALVSHLTNWNWMGYPIDYTISWIADSIIGWILAGTVLAAIIKIQKQGA